MAKIEINFNNENYTIDEASLSVATDALKSHLSTVMNGAGATIDLGGTSYNIDSAKLSAATSNFVSHLGTIAGSGSKVIVGGVEYSVDSSKLGKAITDLETTFGEFKFDTNGGSVVGTWRFNETLQPINKTFEEGFEEVDCNINVMWNDDEVFHTTYWYFCGSSEHLEEVGCGNDDGEAVMYDGQWYHNRIFTIIEEPNDPEFIVWLKANAQPYTADLEITNKDGYLFYSFDGENYLIGYDGDDAELVLPNDYNGESYQIRAGAFSDCIYLTKITIPDSVTGIGESAFSGCTSLTGVYISDLAAWCNISFDNMVANPLYYANNLYLNNTLVTDLVIPDSVTNIYGATFSNCSSLKSVTIPASVTEIGVEAFRGCTSLTSVTIGDSVTSIGSYAFRECTSLTNVTIGDSVTSIGKGAFLSCVSLTSVAIPDSVTSIGDWAFEKCTSLTSVTIGDSVTSIGSYAFRECTSLTYNIYANAKYVGNSVNPYVALIAVNSEHITSCTIHESTRLISHSAFFFCNALVSLAFEGTVSQWSAINKGVSWNSSVPATYVQCSDGTVSLM